MWDQFRVLCHIKLYQMHQYLDTTWLMIYRIKSVNYHDTYQQIHVWPFGLTLPQQFFKVLLCTFWPLYCQYKSHISSLSINIVYCQTI